MSAVVELVVNGSRSTLEAERGMSLLHALREQRGLTGAKYGCGEGQCGACTVLIDGKPHRSCITQASSAAGKHVTTIEGLEKSGKLHPVQQAFLDAGALQCGYCTPGMILTVVSLLHANPNPTDEDVAGALEGNICRCGVYLRIMDAVHRAAKLMKSS
ncbi:MAG: (2Fe-2S)-binding protein [Acidobacteriota bacterium]|nr:(2Fe-2S)-binding protein [Acidobacteriota bacterium]